VNSPAEAEKPFWSETATELASLYRVGAATPTAMLESVLGRIEDVNPRINSLVTLDVAGAREAAAAASQRWRNGTPLGSLDGVPLTVKDNLFVRGLRATWGSLLFAEHVAPQDDLPVARLRAAGAVIVGKTNTPELALAGYTDNRLFGATGNPWAPTLTPGGSSGGAVAGVSAGFGPLAVATDAGGSIRRPSGHTGVAGLKPGVGRVPRRYGFPLLAQDLQVIGLVARAIADLQLAFAAISTTQPERRGAPPAGRSLRIGAFGTVGDAPVDPPVTAAFAAACEALREMGHTVEIIPAPWNREEVDTLFGALTGPGVARVVTGFPGWQTKVTEAIAKQAEAGFGRSAVDYVVALDRLTRFRWAMHDTMAGWDMLATPSAACMPWSRAEPYPSVIAGQPAGPRAGAIFSTAINLAGLPAIVVPAPVPPGDMPAGLQLIGPMNSEERLLDVAARFEIVRPWSCLAPI
jgi:aspartyl-tRNA(Asn)/glutamyl-tRNA(Gln) amidotransferase subunit A